MLKVTICCISVALNVNLNSVKGISPRGLDQNKKWNLFSQIFLQKKTETDSENWLKSGFDGKFNEWFSSAVAKFLILK